MRFNVLGPVTVVADGDTDVTPRGAQQRRLLTALVTAAPDAVSAAALNELLWPGEKPSTNALQSQVSKLRRAFPDSEVVAERGGYALVPGPDDTVDVVEFERLARAGRQAVDEGRSDDAVMMLESALALVRGDPLHDIADSELGQASAARLTALVTSVRSAKLEAELATGRVAEVAAELERLVAAEPLDEHWWALLMTARFRLGRPADALRAFQDARRTLAAELGLEPGPELRRLERQILAHDVALGDETPPDAGVPGGRRFAPLPTRLTSLVGRDDLLAALAAELEHGRLLTLVGPGGAGKTSLAFALARQRDAGTAVFVALAALDDADTIPPTIAAAIGLTGDSATIGGGAGTTLDRIVDAIGGDPLLIVMDNCEHVVDAAAKTVLRLLEGCPGLTAVATSREPLGVPGEIVRDTPSLAVDDAVALFVERASAAAPGFAPTVDERATIAAICSRLDCLPLAIELAAARARSLGLAELLARLDDRFAVLDSGPRTAEPRQQTLRAVVEWSHELLDDSERAVFRRLAAFRGGATLASVEDVCSDDTPGGVAVHEVASVIGRLIDKSSLVVDRRQTTARYWLLQTLAEYADERLHESGELERVRVRHAEHFATLIAPALRGLLGHEQRDWLDVLAVERENLRAALDVAVARGDADLALRLTAPIGWWFYMADQAVDGATALADALACPGPTDPALRALALAHYGWLAANGPDVTAAVDATGEALELVGAFDDPWVESWVMVTRIIVCFFNARLDEARSLLALAVDAAVRAHDLWSLAICDLIEAELAGFDGDAATARAKTDAAVVAFEECGDEFTLALTLTQSAERAEARGDYDGALAMLQRSIELGERGGFSGKPYAARAHLANVEMLRGNLDLAERLHRELLDEFSGNTLPWAQALSCCGLASICRRTGRLDEAARWLDRAWALSGTRDAPIMHVNVRIALGYTADLAGDHEAALRHQLAGLAETTPGGPRHLANALEGLAGALAIGPAASDHALAARLLGAADALRRCAGGPMPPGERFDVDRAERRTRAALGDSAFDTEFEVGAGADVDKLVAEVHARA